MGYYTQYNITLTTESADDETCLEEFREICRDEGVGEDDGSSPNGLQHSMMGYCKGYDLRRKLLTFTGKYPKVRVSVNEVGEDGEKNQTYLRGDTAVTGYYTFDVQVSEAYANKVLRDGFCSVPGYAVIRLDNGQAVPVPLHRDTPMTAEEAEIIRNILAPSKKKALQEEGPAVMHVEKFAFKRRLKKAIRAGYAWPGGYLLTVVMYDGEEMCTGCAKDNWGLISEAISDDDNNGWRAVGVRVYECDEPEDTQVCCNCNLNLDKSKREVTNDPR